MRIVLVALAQIVGAALVGLLLFWLLVRPVLKRSRTYPRTRSPKGTRPTVKLHFDGVIYDLTDDLLRIDDSIEGDAVWVVLGPQHLHFRDMVKLDLTFSTPLPQDTSVAIETVTIGKGVARFMNLNELHAAHPELADKHH